ncbi:MAG: hypothetical protein KDD94_12670 [Calditrichaeota bacterium]|nr:hypothetical protein [Calditrichota bacterium]
MNVNFITDDSLKFNVDNQSETENKEQSARFLKPKTEKETVEVVPEMFKESSEDMFDSKGSSKKLIIYVILLIVVVAGGYFAYVNFGDLLFSKSEQIAETEKPAEDNSTTKIDSTQTDTDATDQGEDANNGVQENENNAENQSAVKKETSTTAIPANIRTKAAEREAMSRFIVYILGQNDGSKIEHIKLENNDLLIEASAPAKKTLSTLFNSLKSSAVANSVSIVSESKRNNQFVSLFSIQINKSDISFDNLLSSNQLKTELNSLLKGTKVIEFEQLDFDNTTSFIVRANATKQVAANFFNQSLKQLNNSRFQKLSVVATPDNKYQLNLIIQIVE